jgi:L-ascorbate metabolism protein UlaG (beta-lactamase superfamily)
MLPDVPVLALPAAARWLRRKGFRAAVSLDVGQRWSVRDVEVVAVGAEHRHRPMPHRPSDACGHVVSAAGRSVWLAGDTELFGGLDDVPAAARGGRVDVAVVPVGGWGPRLSRGHLDADAAAQACARVGASVAVPVHWGTLHAPGGRHVPRGWLHRPGPAFAAALADRAPGCRAVVLHPGQTTPL